MGEILDIYRQFHSIENFNRVKEEFNNSLIDFFTRHYRHVRVRKSTCYNKESVYSVVYDVKNKGSYLSAIVNLKDKSKLRYKISLTK